MLIPKKNFLHIPIGVRLISWATAIRYVGWGFAEMFLPLFFLSFVSNFTETGLLRSIYDIVLLLTLPVVSRLADRISGKKIIISGLIVYPFVALAYFFAGLYGAVIFIAIARSLNGISFALDTVGKRTYMRRHARGHVGIIFGYFDSVSIFWWLTAGVAGLFLIQHFPIHHLLLLIIPTTLIAIFFISFIPHERKERETASRNFLKEVIVDYAQTFLFIKNWTSEQKYITLMYAFMAIIFMVVSFFVPLVSFTHEPDYTLIFLLTAAANLPYLLGIPLGYIADSATTISLRRVMVAGLLLLLALPFISYLWLKLAVIFIIATCVYYSMLVLERLATLHETRSHMGSLSGAFLSISQIGQILSPVVIGLLIDFRSLSFAMNVLFILGIIVIIPLFMKKVRLFEVDK